MKGRSSPSDNERRCQKNTFTKENCRIKVTLQVEISASEMSQSNCLGRSLLEAKFKLTNPNCRFARDVKAAIMMLGDQN